MVRVTVVVPLLVLIASSSDAHYSMLLPDKPWAKKDEKVTFTYQFGHPYEHEMSDAPRPEALMVINPKGKREVLDVVKTLKSIKKDGADAKKVTAWQFEFTPPERGDYTFEIMTPPMFHDNQRIVDSVRVVVHVQTQNGWDTTTTTGPVGYAILPDTRPYGLLPGMIFKGRVVWSDAGKIMPSRSAAPIEFEKYNEKPPKKLPPDELITFRTKTDDSGSFVVSLPEAGWWGITATKTSLNKLELSRATLWVHVDEKK